MALARGARALNPRGRRYLSAAIGADWAWGGNEGGRLGDGTAIQRLRPSRP